VTDDGSLPSEPGRRSLRQKLAAVAAPARSNGIIRPGTGGRLRGSRLQPV